MLRTTVYLDDDMAIAVRHLAEVQKRSQADVIREAIGTYVAKAERDGDQRKLPGVGKYRSGRSDVSEKAEQLLRKAARANAKRWR